MATVKDSVPHLARTAADERQRTMYRASIGRIEQVNSKIRLLRLYLENDQAFIGIPEASLYTMTEIWQPPLRHLPGQYVDLYIPEVDRVGGFTITSPPQTAMRLPAPTPSTTTPPSAATFDDPYVELAIQKAMENPPAAYLWKAPEQIMNAPVQFRIGGNFSHPPMTLSMNEFRAIDNIVLIAGGVGINPIMSMLTAMEMQGAKRLGGLPSRLRVLYTSKRSKDEKGQPEEVLFEERLKAIANKAAEKHKSVDFQYTFFETSDSNSEVSGVSSNMKLQRRRIQVEDLLEALGPESLREQTLVYVCGLPDMTDEYVDLLRKVPGMDEKRVFCEKWW